MSWKDKLKAGGKFRGAPFVIDGSEFEGGRRTVVHEFPFRSDPETDDMGRRARRFTVEAFVIGAEYMAARDKLIAELEKSGPGELVHPYYGTRQVALAGPFRVRETTRDGGSARFTLEFVEVAKAKQPEGTSDPRALLQSAIDAARAATQNDFLNAYNEAAAFVATTSEQLRKATQDMRRTMARVQQERNKAAIFAKRVSDFEDAADALVRTPEVLFSQLVDLFDQFDNGKAVAGVYSFNPGVRPPATTPNRRAEQGNFDATYRATQCLAMLRTAELAPAATYDSFEDALAVRAEIADRIDEQAENASDESYPLLVQLRVDIARALPGDGRGLAHLVEHTPASTVPSLVLAFRLYGHLDLEEDLIARNGVQHPGFILGGRALEVLSE